MAPACGSMVVCALDCCSWVLLRWEVAEQVGELEASDSSSLFGVKPPRVPRLVVLVGLIVSSQENHHYLTLLQMGAHCLQVQHQLLWRLKWKLWIFQSIQPLRYSSAIGISTCSPSLGLRTYAEDLAKLCYLPESILWTSQAFSHLIVIRPLWNW